MHILAKSIKGVKHMYVALCSIAIALFIEETLSPALTRGK